MGRRTALGLLAAVAMAASGCGYSLAGRGSFLPADIRVIGVPLIENRTAVPRVEQVLTEKVRTEFIGRRPDYTVIPAQAGADAVLSGAITTILVQPAGLDTQQFASRYLFTVIMRVQFTDARTNEVLWANEALTFREEVDVATRNAQPVDAAVFLEQEGPAFDRISSDLARTVVSAILEAF